MIKFEYKPWEPERTWGFAEDLPPVEELTMTLGDGVSWEEATDEFHNFLRGAGYVIPYYNVNEADEDDYVDCSDPPDMDKSGSLGDRQPKWANRMSGPDKWWNDESNIGVASEDESNTDVAEEEDRLRAKKKQIYEDLKDSVDREWVGLTDEEINEAVQFPWHFIPFARAIEQILKEKNT